MLRYESKKSGEKLVNVSAEIESGIVKKIIISGDFFIHPEDSIDTIQNFLTGININGLSKEILKTDLDKFILENGIEMIGISSETLVEALASFAAGI